MIRSPGCIQRKQRASVWKLLMFPPTDAPHRVLCVRSGGAVLEVLQSSGPSRWPERTQWLPPLQGGDQTHVGGKKQTPSLHRCLSHTHLLRLSPVCPTLAAPLCGSGWVQPQRGEVDHPPAQRSGQSILGEHHPGHVGRAVHGGGGDLWRRRLHTLPGTTSSTGSSLSATIYRWCNSSRIKRCEKSFLNLTNTAVLCTLCLERYLLISITYYDLGLNLKYADVTEPTVAGMVHLWVNSQHHNSVRLRVAILTLLCMLVLFRRLQQSQKTAIVNTVTPASFSIGLLLLLLLA